MATATIDILTVSATDKKLHRKFMRFPHDLYAGNNNWVPFFNIDMRAYLTRRHPYYQNYPAQFFIAERDGAVVGTLSVSYNHRYVESHNINTAHFFFYDVIDDIEVSRALFEQGYQWARARGATHIMGPLQSGLAVGSGLLIEGFEYPGTMTMMRYNFPYYATHLSELGFGKHADLNSYCTSANAVKRDPRVERMLEVVRKRGHFHIKTFKNKREFLRLAADLFEIGMNELVGDYPENYPLLKNEQRQMLKDIAPIVRMDTILILMCDGKPVGYGLGFPDVTKAIQKSKGKINPLSILRLLYNKYHADGFACNGIGVLPEYQGRGGNVLIYTGAYDTIQAINPKYIECTQIGEKTEAISSEMRSFFEHKNKVHRILMREL